MIYLILLIALLFRLITVGQSLWLDESIGGIAARDYSFSQILTSFIRSDNHPPLYYLVLKIWTAIFGFSEISIRFPSIIFGLLTIFIVYKIGESLLKNKLAATLTAVFIATSQFHIYYSQEARMYSMAAFLASLSVFYFIKTIKDKNINFNKNWTLFSLGITALIFTDYVPIFMLVVFWLYALLFNRNKNWWKFFILSHVPLLILGLIWLPIFIAQTKGGEWLLQTLPAWKTIAGGATFKQLALIWIKFSFGRISLFDKKLYYGLVLLSSIPLVYSLFIAFKNKVKEEVLIWYWLVLPVSIGFLSSFPFPLFIYYRFVYIIPVFYLIIALGISKLDKPWLKISLACLIISFNLISWGIYVRDPNQQREEWRQAVSYIENRIVAKDTVLFEYPEPFTPFRFYKNGNYDAFGATDSISSNRDKTIVRVDSLVENKSGVYYFNYLKDLTDPESNVQKELAKLGYKEKEIKSFVGVGNIYYYVK